MVLHVTGLIVGKGGNDLGKGGNIPPSMQATLLKYITCTFLHMTFKLRLDARWQSLFPEISV